MEYYGRVLDDITAEQAKKIAEAKNVGIVICSSKLSKEVKDIFKDAEIVVYEDVSNKDIKEAFKKLNQPPSFINQYSVIPGGSGKPIYELNNTIRLDGKGNL